LCLAGAVTLALSLLAGVPLGAQTAHFGGAVATLGSGFVTPTGVAVDGSGNVYVADNGNSAVKEIVAVNGRIPASPVINTLGSGFANPFTVAVDGSGNVFVGDTNSGLVKEIVAAGGYTTVNVLSSGFNGPNGVAVDGGGNVFVADTFNQEVKEIVAAGGYSTVNPLGSGFDAPYGVAVDGSGNVFVADFATNTVKEMKAVNGSIPASPTIKTLASGLDGPDGVAVDGSGNVFVANYNNNTVQEIVAVNGSIPATPTIKTIGSGFSSPSNLSVDGIGNVFVSDTGNSEVKEIVAAGGYTKAKILGSGFNFPEAVAVNGSVNVIVADTGNNAVDFLDYADMPSVTFASTAVGLTSSDSPQTVTLSNDGNAALILPLPTTGDNPSVSANFTRDPSSTCMQTTPSSSTPFELAEGASCTMALDFEPTMVGAISGSAVLTDNNLNLASDMQAIALIGTGLLGSQTISFTQPASPVYYGVSPITLSATGGASGNPVTFSIISAPGSLSGTNNSVLTVTGAGTIVIAANQAGSANYAAAPQVTRSITVLTATPAALTSPTPGSTLTGSSVAFTWTAGNGVTAYQLELGTTGVGSSNLYNSGGTTATTETVSGLPTNGVKVYSRLYQMIDAKWQSTDYTYTAQ